MGNIIVVLILGVLVGGAVRTIYKNRKGGNSNCGGDCGRCGGCH